jgi:hypothetical protein
MIAIRKTLDAAAPVSAHITPEDRAAIAVKRAEFLRTITDALINLRRLVKVRQTLNVATRIEDVHMVRDIDGDAEQLVRDIGGLIEGATRLDADAGIKFNGDLLRLRNVLAETRRSYQDAKAAKPAKLRKAKPSGERVRLLRERRKRGVRHVVPVEITDAHLQDMIDAGLLTAEEAADRKSVIEVVEDVIGRIIAELPGRFARAKAAKRA